jgi:hypothetical protein
MVLFTITDGEIIVTLDGFIVAACCCYALLMLLGAVLGGLIICSWMGSWVYRIHKATKEIKAQMKESL